MENHDGFCDCLEYRDDSGNYYEFCWYQIDDGDDALYCTKEDSICECTKCQSLRADEDVISEAFSKSVTEGSVISSAGEEEEKEGEVAMWVLDSGKNPAKVFIPQPQGCLRTTPRDGPVKKEVRFDKVWVRNHEQDSRGFNIMYPGAFYFNISDYYYQL